METFGNGSLKATLNSLHSLNSVSPLHYGGTLTGKKGVLGRSPNKGGHFKVRRRHETIARLENAGFTKPQIAPMIGISTNKLTHIMNSADYLIVRIAITHGVVVDHTAQLATIKAQRKEMMTQLLPQGLQAIANILQSNATTIADKKLQVAVAQDLFDREGTFAKISRTEVKAVDEFDFHAADKASDSLINILRATSAPKVRVDAGNLTAGNVTTIDEKLDGSQHTLEAIEANKEFSNSQTLSSMDQQEALKLLEDAAASGEMDAEILRAIPTQSGAAN